MMFKCAYCDKEITPGHEQPRDAYPDSPPICPVCATMQLELHSVMDEVDDSITKDERIEATNIRQPLPGAKDYPS